MCPLIGRCGEAGGFVDELSRSGVGIPEVGGDVLQAGVDGGVRVGVGRQRGSKAISHRGNKN